MGEFFRGFIERLQPDRVRTARFSAIDGILWLEFGDGLIELRSGMLCRSLGRWGSSR